MFKCTVHDREFKSNKGVWLFFECKCEDEEDRKAERHFHVGGEMPDELPNTLKKCPRCKAHKKRVEGNCPATITFCPECL